MKKYFVVSLFLILAVLCAACGGSKKENNTGGPDSGGGNLTSEVLSSGGGAVPENGKTAAFFDMFQSGTYHMKAKMLGSEMDVTMEYYFKDEMMVSMTETAGQKTKMIMRDNKMYIVDDASKTAMILPALGNTTDEAIITSGMTMTDSGTANFNGKNLQFEEYSQGNAVKAQYFVDGNNLAGIRNISSEGTIDIVILELDKNIPSNAFDIPANYQQVGSF